MHDNFEFVDFSSLCLLVGMSVLHSSKSHNASALFGKIFVTEESVNFQLFYFSYVLLLFNSLLLNFGEKKNNKTTIFQLPNCFWVCLVMYVFFFAIVFFSTKCVRFYGHPLHVYACNGHRHFDTRNETNSFWFFFFSFALWSFRTLHQKKCTCHYSYHSNMQTNFFKC